MKTFLFIISMTGMIPLFAEEPGTMKTYAPGAYVLLKTDQNISLYSQWVPLNETVSTRKVKAVFSCSASVDDVIGLIRTDGAFVQWMSGLSAYTRLKTENDNTWFSYIRYGLPWPLSDQDCVVRYAVEHSADGNSARILVTGVPDYIAPKEGVTGIPHLECEWVIRKTRENRVVIEFSQYSKQEPQFPRWATDPIIQKSLIRSCVAFRGLVEQNEIH